MKLTSVNAEIEVVTVSFANSVVNLQFGGFEQNIDLDDYVSIDYGNIYAELITISPLMNRIGIWRAQAEGEYDEYKLECKIYEAGLGERLIKSLATTTVSSGNLRYPSNERVERCILLDEGVLLRRKKLYRLKKEFQYMDSFYWALKEKAGKLNRISESMNLSPIDFESHIVEGSINGYLIKKQSRHDIG